MQHSAEKAESRAAGSGRRHRAQSRKQSSRLGREHGTGSRKQSSPLGRGRGLDWHLG